MSDTDKATHQADCDRRIVDVICEYLEQSGLRTGALAVREMAAEIGRLKTEAERMGKFDTPAGRWHERDRHRKKGNNESENLVAIDRGLRPTKGFPVLVCALGPCSVATRSARKK